MLEICLFFYVGVYNLYFTKLKSRVTFYIVLIVTLEGKERSLNVKSDIFDLWILSRSRNLPSQKERLLAGFQIQWNSNSEGKRNSSGL